MGEATGTIRKAVIDGVSFDVMADASITFLRSNYEKEATPTSGDPLIKMTKRNQNIESLDLGCTPSEMETLSDLANNIDSVPLSLELADTSTYKAVGHINFEGYESETGKITVTLIPTSEWTPALS